MGLFPISPAKEKGLKERMDSLNIREDDRGIFYSFRGKGGQR